MEVNVDKYVDQVLSMITDYGPKLIMALVTLFIGMKIINFILNLIDKAFEKRNVDKTLRPFLHKIIGSTLKIILFISVISMLGVATTSFVALIGAAGLAVGLSLQGTLANFASGVLLLVFRPFKIGDVLETAGHIGVVKEIRLFTTQMNTFQNRDVIIPNSTITSSSMTNYSTNNTARVDLTIGISYDANIKDAKDIFLDILNKEDRILKSPAPQIVVGELGDSSVNIHVRPWVKTPDYWDVYFAVLEQCKLRLDEAGIGIPYPQTDVHLHTVENK